MSRTRFVYSLKIAALVGVVALLALSPHGPSLKLEASAIGYPWYPYPCPLVSGGRDFNGDGSERGQPVFNPRTSTWVKGGQETGGAFAASVQWGQWGDIPVPGDYNADGTDDYAVWRPGTATWHVLCSSATNCAGGTKSFAFGAAGDIPVPTDYNNDGFTDYGVWRPDTGHWFVHSGANTAVSLVAQQWGAFGDCPVPARLSGSGAGDLELNVWRPYGGVWYFGRTLAGAGGSSLQFGQFGDIPLTHDADLDGDGEMLVWRPDGAVWYGTGQGSGFAIQWGEPTDVPTSGQWTGVGWVLNAWRPEGRTAYACVGPFIGGTSCTQAGVWSGSPYGLTGDIPLNGQYK